MNDQKLKRIVRAKMLAANFELEAGTVESFMDFIAKFKIALPSKEKAKKTLEKYTQEDIEKAYSAIPKIVNMFKSKNAESEDKMFSRLQYNLIKNVTILICLISFAGGIMPKNPKAAVEKLQAEKVISKNFDYIGKIMLYDVVKFVDAKDSFEEATKKIVEGIKKGDIAFTGSLPEDENIKIYKDRDFQIKTTKELLNYGGVYLKLSK